MVAGDRYKIVHSALRTYARANEQTGVGKQRHLQVIDLYDLSISVSPVCDIKTMPVLRSDPAANSDSSAMVANYNRAMGCLLKERVVDRKSAQPVNRPEPLLYILHGQGNGRKITSKKRLKILFQHLHSVLDLGPVQSIENALEATLAILSSR